MTCKSWLTEAPFRMIQNNLHPDVAENPKSLVVYGGIGRAARNSEGHVIMYADKITDSMRNAIDETERRRRIQQEYNKEHNITPKTIQKSVRDLISVSKKVAQEELNFKKDPESMNKEELTKLIADIQKKMQRAAADLNFEAAAEYRDQMLQLKTMLQDL